MDSIKSFYNKHKALILYLFYGVLTVLVNLAVFFVLFDFIGIHYVAADVLAWIAAVTFAFLTNRRFVFASDKKGKAVISEAAAFFAARLFSLGVEVLLLYGGESLNCDMNIVKIIASVIVVILNYYFSKLIIFKK